MNQSPEKPASYMPHIDGLRGIAVLAVLLYHLNVPYFGGGFIGVDIFFVISGFLITGLIVRDLDLGRFSFADFYARRIKRLFPALFGMLLLTVPLAAVFSGPREFSLYFKAIRYAAAQIPNIFFNREIDYFDIGDKLNPLLHTWSLGVEQQFYLVWPIVLFLAYKLWGRGKYFIVLSLIFIASLITSEYLVRHDTMSAFYLLHSRAWELALGGIVALNVLPRFKNRAVQNGLSVLGIGMIIAPALLYTETHFPGAKALLPCLGAALFIHTAQQEHGIGHRLLSCRALVFTGLISYSLYLWHWPLIAFYKSYFGTDLSWDIQLGIGGLSFVAGWLSYKFIEQPTRHARLSTKKIFAIAAMSIVFFVVGSNLLKSQNEAGWRVAYKADKAITRANDYYKTCAVEGGAYNREDCIIGPNKDQYEVILTGDSHAAHFIPTVVEWANSKNLTVRIFLRGACRSFVLTDDPVIRYGKADTYCMDLVPAFYETLEQDAHIQYVFVSLMLSKGTDDLRRSLDKIQSHGKKIYYLGSVPFFEEDPHECHIKNNLLISKLFPRETNDCLAVDEVFSGNKIRESHDSLKPMLAGMGIPYFDPLPHMPTPFDEQGHFLFMDNNHLNQYGGVYLWPYLARFIEENPVFGPSRP